jgi:hypothetical protein
MKVAWGTILDGLKGASIIAFARSAAIGLCDDDVSIPAGRRDPDVHAAGYEPPPGGSMIRKVVYWGSTGIVGLMLLFALSYLTGNEQVVSGFAKAGYPQHLRVVLGVAKPLAAIVLLLPGLALLKEWAYAGATFAWVMAFISAYSSGEGAQVLVMPPVLLALLALSYVTRPPGRRLK